MYIWIYLKDYKFCSIYLLIKICKYFYHKLYQSTNTVITYGVLYYSVRFVLYRTRF